MALFQKKGKKGKGERISIPRSVTESIPYVSIYETGIIEVRPGFFSQSYLIPAVSFKTATDEKQWDLAVRWSDFLSSFDAGTTVEVTLLNETVDMDAFRSKIFIQMKGDNLNEYREEYNQMLKAKITGTKNNLETKKVLTVTVEAIDIVAATEKLVQIESMVRESMISLTGSSTAPLTMNERLDLLNRVYNFENARPVYARRMIEGHLSESFTLANCAAQGITSKDLIAPESLEFGSDKGKVGSRLMKAFFVAAYPTYIRGTILTDFTQIATNMLVSVYFEPMDLADGLKLVREKSVNIKSEVIQAEKSAAKNNIYGDVAIPTTLNDAKQEADELMNQINRENEKLFMVTFLFVLFARDEKEMEGFESQLRFIANKNLLTVRALNLQQEAGLNSALPIGNNLIPQQKMMPTRSVASIIPFDVKEVRQKGGMYYGQNAVSGNMIIYNRLMGQNPNGCVLGMPGSGKSFAAKREIVNVLLNTEDEVYILDPEREYTPLAEAFGGSIVELTSASSVHINPFDLNLQNYDEKSGDPLKNKSDFIETICEIMVGGRYGLSPAERTVIGRSVINVYEPYLQYLRRRGLDQDVDHAPTLVEFYNDLCAQPNLEAQNLALSLERYVKGSANMFAYRSNISLDNRFVVYDINSIGSGMKELGLHIALDNIWNKMIDNFAKKKRTWLYVDEFYLLMQKKTSAEYISQIWKRARKWSGVPTAITQNVEDMLKNESARAVINTSSFVILMGQSAMNRQELSRIYDISTEEQKYISTAKPGRGLICIGDKESAAVNLIPLDDSFPTNTKLYKIMTTDPKDKF